jgi:hypothetical protein
LGCALFINASIINNYRQVSSDFVQDYIASYSLRNGGALYGENITKLSKEMLGFNGIENFHPPFNALLFMPLSFLNYQTAYVALGLISIVLLLLINQLVVKGLNLGDEWFLNLMCFTLLWYPVFYCLGTGQSSMIIAACLVSGWFCLRSEKTNIASFLFAIATLIKLFPGLVMLYLFMNKKWRAFFATALFITIGIMLTIFIVGFDNIKTYSINMVAKDIDEWRNFVLNHSVSGMVARVFGEQTPWTEPFILLHKFDSFLIILLNSGILLYSALKMRVIPVKKELADYAFGLTIVGMLLLSPITWGHIFPVLILPISLLLKEYIKEPSTQKLRVLLLIILFVSLPDVFIARGLMAIYHPFRMPWYSMLLTLGPSAGIVLLWIVLSRHVAENRIMTGKCY